MFFTLFRFLGFTVFIFSSNGIKNEFSKHKNLLFCNDINKACSNVDLVIIHTEWEEFKALDFRKLNKKKKFKKVILCSIHQLPQKQKRIEDLINTMDDVEFHFALESISGKGSKFLLDCIKEAKMFMNAKSIDSTKTTWLELYKMMQEKGTR